MSSIVLEGVTKCFGEHVAADNVDLVVPEGKFTVFVGPSGCGKTTLLRLIAGLEQIDAGRLLIDGIDMADTSPAARGLAMVFQSYALYPHMTVRGNLGFALKAARASRTEIAERVARVAKMLDLDRLLDRRPAALSGGQRQRVAIGRALVREPRAFLFDEPLSNLDAELRAQMRFEIRRLQQTLGVTTVYVTHDQAEAMTMADQIAVFRAGRIEQVGTPLDIYRHPANRFVAGFIGSPKMNFLEAPAAAAYGAASIGIRPQHITLDRVGAIAATIETIEHLGNESFAHVRLTTGEGLIVRVESGLDLSEGADVRLRFDPDHIHRFDTHGTTLPAGSDNQDKEAGSCISNASA